ncbi:MAG: hypothetical protein WKG00_03390 [Polyangiaceae bacterium]
MSHLRTFALGLVVGLLAFTCSGCGAAGLDAAVRVANGAREVEVTAGEILRVECTEAYQRASTAARIAELDDGCLPARAAYGSLRAARLTTVAAIIAAQAGGSAAGLPAAAAALAAAAGAAADTAAALEK